MGPVPDSQLPQDGEVLRPGWQLHVRASHRPVARQWREVLPAPGHTVGPGVHVGRAPGPVPLLQGAEGGTGQQVRQGQGKPEAVLLVLDRAR